ncbi:putative transposase [Erwinia pyrifoliae Ep1/96]|nr:putative transposase [Erwinia pyrifoliae Ep1/96]
MLQERQTHHHTAPISKSAIWLCMQDIDNRYASGLAAGNQLAQKPGFQAHRHSHDGKKDCRASMTNRTLSIIYGPLPDWD